MKRIVSLGLVLALIISLCACGGSSGGKTGSIQIEEVESPAELNTFAVKPYLTDDNLNNFTVYRGSGDQSIPEGVRFSWKWTGDKKVRTYAVRASESKKFENFFIERTNHTSVKMYNFKLNTKYYWQVTATTEDGEDIKSEIGEFTTADGVARMIYCEGVPNMRDLGGWKTEDGKTVKQGMIYRCAKLNDNNSTRLLITDDGMDTLKRLGIRGEIDLRGSDEATIKQSAIEGASYINVPIAGKVAEHNYFVSNSDQLVRIFEFLGNRNNYPLIIHCSVGADRTGFVAYTLTALLGLSEKDASRDYLLTNYAYTPNRMFEGIACDYVAGYNSCPGATLSEKAENHLLSLGVKKEDIDTFKMMMLG